MSNRNEGLFCIQYFLAKLIFTAVVFKHFLFTNVNFFRVFFSSAFRASLNVYFMLSESEVVLCKVLFIESVLVRRTFPLRDLL